MSSFPQAKQKHTYRDYLTWPADERWEIIDGTAYNMTPSPPTVHQMVVGRFYARLERMLTGTPCQPFVAPTDVVLSENDVVQPDVFVVCERAKIKEAAIFGPPELIIEVLSPHTALKDKREKKALYERCGVKEYVIADPVARYAERFFLSADGTYGKGEIFGPQEKLTLKVLGDLEIPLWEVFGER